MTYLLEVRTDVPLDATEIPTHIENKTAALFVGIILNWALFGVLMVQLYIYIINYSKTDTTRIKSLVYGLCVLEVVQTTLATMDGFHWFVYGWGNMNNLLDIHMAAVNSPIMDGLIGAIAQSYFCWRIYQLGGGPWCKLAYFLLLIAFTQMAAGFATGIRAMVINNSEVIRILSSQVVETAIWLGGSALVDVLIAISMTILLARSRTNMPHTDDVIGKLIRSVIETNALTAGVAVLTLILFIAFPKDNYFLCPPYILSKLYSNTVLAILNNRINLSNRFRKSMQRSPNPQLSLSGSQERSYHQGQAQQGSGENDHRMAVMVKVHQESHCDPEDVLSGASRSPSKVNFDRM